MPAFGGQPDGGAVRQRQFGAGVAEGQTADDRGFCLGAQPFEHRRHVVAAIVGAERVAIDMADQHRALRVDHPGLQQLDQHAFDAVGMLVDVLQKEDAALDLRKVGRAEQSADDRQIAAPQRALLVDTLGAFGLEAQDFEFAAHGLAKAAQRHRIDRFR